MRRTQFVLAVSLLSASAVCSAGNYVVPTTTLAAQTANNTSTSSSFSSQSNGNLGTANISKVDIHTLLYSGAKTKIYAHMLLWFGQSNHMNIGYSSTDPAQIKRQIDDMVSRGIDGIIIDWYGPNNAIDQATQLVMAEAENHPGFTFAIMIDQGALEWDSCSGCSPQQALVSQLQYIEQTYFPSPAYMKMGGHPVITNFNVDLSFSVDWTAATASLSSKPAYIFQNNSGFSHILSDGSYSWVMPTTTDYGIGYLSSFYNAGMSSPNEQTIGAVYKGFNDTLASWGSDRIMKQQCGQTWLNTFSEINNIYNSSNELPLLQLVTWNDYEEATEIESGIDSCVAVSASLSGNNLQWKISGDESTVDHYTTYISTDGQNLMPLAENQPGNRSVALCSFPIPNGRYQLFVQATGKPGLANRITGPIAFTAACSSTGGGSPSLSFGASPLSISIPAGKSGNFTVLAQVQSGVFNNPIALSCGNLPTTLSCSFSPASIIPGAGSASSVLTISAVTMKGLNRTKGSWNFIYATGVFPIGIGGFVFIGRLQRRRVKQLIAICLIAGAGLVCISCSGRPSSMQSVSSPPVGSIPSNYSVTINGASNAAQVSTTVNVTVQ